MISEVFASGHKYLRIVNLTGTDYPLWSNDELLAAFTDMSKEYLIGQRLDVNPWQASRVLVFYCMEHGKYIMHLFKALKIKRYRDYSKLGYDFYFGSEYWALTYDCVKKLMMIWDSDARIQGILKNAFAPSEIWIHTMFFASEYKELGEIVNGDYQGLQRLAPLSYFNYGKKVKVLTEDDYDDALNSGKMFARKIVIGTSDKLIEMIDRNR